MLGGRTRAALEREKTLVLRSIKELEFDRGMGKVSEKDFAEMSARLRARAARLMRQLDAGSVYREQIEREIERTAVGPESRSAVGPVACASCNVANDRDARFCKSCGARLGTRVMTHAPLCNPERPDARFCKTRRMPSAVMASWSLGSVGSCPGAGLSACPPRPRTCPIRR